MAKWELTDENKSYLLYVIYGSEVWGMGNNDIVERICKLLLHVKKKKKKKE
jgi:hypothetical protein